MDKKWQQIDALIKGCNKIVLSTHEKPDGDGLGSALSFYYYLKELNKEVRIIQPSNFPEQYRVIDPDSIVETYSDDCKPWIESSDLLILFDIGHHKRARDVSKIAINNNIDVICIDHHKNDDLDIFKASFIDIDVPATGLLAWKYLKHKGLDASWDIKIFNALYAALSTDTGSFKYSNTTPESHKMASELLEFGVKPYDIYAPIYENRKLSQLRLMSYVINNLKFNINNKVCSAFISTDVLTKTDSCLEDIDGFTEFLRAIENVEVSFLITEQKDLSYRINFRSKGRYIINDIASELGGGGHKFAAGCSVSNSTVIEIQQKILNLLKSKMEENVN
tara:strand:+ start:185 stop:1189 length:1005 start_codon:yes stop_codon:yes gene_type:complete